MTANGSWREPRDCSPTAAGERRNLRPRMGIEAIYARRRTTRARYPIRAHQRDRLGVSSTGTTGGLGGHEKEGSGRELPQRQPPPQ